MRKIQVLLLSIFITNVMMAQTLEEAKTALNNENFIRAKNILTKLVAGGADKKAAYYLGNAYLRLEDADSAKIFYTIASTDGKTANAYLAQGRLALLANDKTAAKAAFERASIASKMKDAEVLFQAGEAFYKPTPPDL